MRRVDAGRAHRVEDGEQVRRSAQDYVWFEVLDQLDLLLRLATRDRDHRAAELLGAVVRAEPTGEQAVAVGIVDLVARADTRCAKGTGHQRGPVLKIGSGVADDGWLPRCP